MPQQRGRRTTLAPLLTCDEYQRLTRLTQSLTAPAGVARRAHCILAIAGGASISEASRRFGMARPHIHKWLKRWREAGVAGLSGYKSGRPVGWRKHANPAGA